MKKEKIVFYASELNGCIEVGTTEMSAEEIEAQLEGGEEKLISHFEIPHQSLLLDEWDGETGRNSMEILHSLLLCDGMQPTFERLLTEVFEGGMNAVKPALKNSKSF